jgi:type II secretory pathway pseudopilin PulG
MKKRNYLYNQKDNTMASTAGSRQAGFTLIDVSILLIIISLLLLPLLGLSGITKKNQMLIDASDRRDLIASALMDYAILHGAYPVPANPTINIDDNDEEAGKSVAGFAPYTNCTASSAPVNGVICRPGGRDAASTTGADPILIGALPYANLGLKPEDTIDQFGHKYLYAVSAQLTSKTTYKESAGSLSVIDQNAKQIVDNYEPISTYSTGNNVQEFVVVSAGENGYGAYMRSGARDTCPTDGSQESENCDDDAVFSQYVGTWNQQDDMGGPPNAMRNESVDARFDDMLVYSDSVNANGRLWSQQAGSNNVYSAEGTSRKVGIGVEYPTSAVHVKGNARAEQVYTPRICNAAKTNCFNVSSMMTSEKKVTGTASNSLICDDALNNGLSDGAERALEAVTLTSTSAATATFPAYPTCDDDGVEIFGGSKTECPDGANGFTETGALKCL